MPPFSLRFACTLLFLASFLFGCGGKGEPPLPPSKPFGPDERILVVANSWRESTQSEGYLHEPDVAYMRVKDTFTLHLEEKSLTALVDVNRVELLRNPEGREFHCKVTGAIKASVTYAWLNGEPTVAVNVPPASLPRRCKESGFSRLSKQFPALSATYALRGDQLIAIEPITLRSALLPAN